MDIDPIITLNIAGTRFQYLRSLFLAYPDTYLGKLLTQNPTIFEFHINWSATFFDYVVRFYLTKVLVKPKGIDEILWQQELAFWQLPRSPLQQIVLSERQKWRDLVAKWMNAEYNILIDLIRRRYLASVDQPDKYDQAIQATLIFSDTMFEECLPEQAEIVGQSIGAIFENHTAVALLLVAEKYLELNTSTEKISYQDVFNDITTQIIDRDFWCKCQSKITASIDFSYAVIHNPAFRRELQMILQANGFQVEWQKHMLIKSISPYPQCHYTIRDVPAQIKIENDLAIRSVNYASLPRIETGIQLNVHPFLLANFMVCAAESDWYGCDKCKFNSMLPIESTCPNKCHGDYQYVRALVLS